MEYYLDKLIPILVLGAVAAFLVYLVRRAASEKDIAPRAEVVPMPMKLAEIVVVPPPTPEPLQRAEEEPVVERIVVGPPAVGEGAKPRRKKQMAPVSVKAAVNKTPIEAVLELLKKKDSLAAAFLLGEILAPPVSKRNEPAAQARK